MRRLPGVPQWLAASAALSVAAACSSDDGAEASDPSAGGSGGSVGIDGNTDAGSDSAMDPNEPVDPETLATEAFIWGYPAVVTQRTLQFLGGLVGVNTLFNQMAISNSAIRVIVAPNQDTLYSIAIADLRRGPVVLTVPAVTDRYWTYQFLDAWTESFHYIGTRATRGSGGSYVVTPPGWDGELPAGTEPIESPTPQLFILGRFHVRGDADVANITALDRSLVPLHEVTGEPPPPPLPDLGEAPGAPSDTGLDGATFFDELGDALAKNGPASDHDRAAMERFAAMGVGPGMHPAADGDDATRALLDRAVEAGFVALDEAATSREPINGWTTAVDIGRYGVETLLRAVVARIGWGANVPQEAVYPISRADADGTPYVGSTSYVMHFEPGQIPPVDPVLGFWSVTAYGTDMFFVQNPLERYAINDLSPNLELNADGSLDLYLQPDAPAGLEGNWLPTPPGGFVLMMRMYLPEIHVVDGTYVPPRVVPQ